MSDEGPKSPDIEFFLEEESIKRALEKVDERTLFLKLLFKAAEKVLQSGSSKEIELLFNSFCTACKCLPEDGDLFFQRAILAIRRHEIESEEDLEEAICCLKKSLALKGPSFDLLSVLSTSTFRLGFVRDDIDMLDEGERLFSEAASMGEKEAKAPLRADLYWNWAVARALLAEKAGEADDWKIAISYFRKAKSLGLRAPEFFADFAESLINFGKLIRAQEFFFEAMILAKDSLQGANLSEDLDPGKKESLADRYFCLGSAASELFEMRLEESLFSEADDAFEKAKKFSPSRFAIWFRWGTLLLTSTKLWQEVSILEAAIEKFRFAFALRQDDPILLGRLGQALGMLGQHQEEIALLRQAESFIHTGLLLEPESEELLLYHAELLSHFGRYFGDEKYFINALNVLRDAKKLYPSSSEITYQIAQTTFFLGDSKADSGILEGSLPYFESISESEISRFAYFWNSWGMTCLALGDLEQSAPYLKEAQTRFEKAIALHEIIIPEWFLNYGLALLYQGDLLEDESYYEMAIGAFRAALSRDPEFLIARAKLASALSRFGQEISDLEPIREACLHFEAVTKQDCEDEEVFSEWGLALMHIVELTRDDVLPCDMTLLDKAERCFLQAQNLGSEGANYNLACLYSFKGDLLRALHFFEKAYETSNLPPLSIIASDDWLDNIRPTPLYKEVIERLRRLEENS
jgi:tetratricopeptide (TPR) repeat protein